MDPAEDKPDGGGEASRGASSVLRGGGPREHHRQRDQEPSAELREGPSVPPAEAASERDHEVQQRGGQAADEPRQSGAELAKEDGFGLERGSILKELGVREVLYSPLELRQRGKVLDASDLRLVRLLQGQLDLERKVPLGLLDSGRQRQLERPCLRADLRPLLDPESGLRVVLAADAGRLQREILGSHVGQVLGRTLLGHVLHQELGLLHEELDRLQNAVRGRTVLG